MTTPEIPFGHWLRRELLEMTAYTPKMGDYPIRLDANEAPSLLPAEVKEAMVAEVSRLAWERYPDPTARRLRQALAKRMGAAPEEVLVGVGSDELIALLLTAFDASPVRAEPPTVLVMTPTFVMYKMSAKLRGWQVGEVPLDRDWDLSERAVTIALDTLKPRLVFVASPNNPTGNLMDEGRLCNLVESAPDTLWVIDEAYVDYAPRHQLALRQRFPNLLFLRTLSKIGFASLRVGWLTGPARLIRELDKVRQPYNLNSVGQCLAALVLERFEPELAAIVELVRSERSRITKALADWPGIEVTPSDANFLWIRSQTPGGEVFEQLGRRGILVRGFHERGGRLANQLRVTLGTPEQNDRFLQVLGECL